MGKYHKWSKDDKFLRKAIYEAYGQRCDHCGEPITVYSNIHVDHIYPKKAPASDDAALNQFLEELRQDGFDTDNPDYIENYRLLCGNCNRKKSNHLRKAVYYRDMFQETERKTPKILELIDKYKKHIPTDIDKFIPSASVECLTKMPPAITGEDIIHRETDLQEIQKLLEDTNRNVLLSGFGGIGKTALAQLLFHNIKAEFDEVAWIPYQGSFANSVLTSIPYDAPAETPEVRYEKIIRDLMNNGKKKLMVIDNADHDSAGQDPAKDFELKEITGWLNTTCIITSRLNRLTGYQTYTVGFLSPDACLDLFFLHSEHSRTYDNENAAKALIELARCHTYTVELLAKGGNCENNLLAYYNELKEKGFSFPEIEVDADKDQTTATIAQHLKILFDLRSRTEMQSKLLQCFAALPVGVLLNKKEINQWLGFDINTVEPLVKVGWLSRDNGIYTMHPLVKEIILLDSLPEDTCSHFLSFIADARNGFFSDNEVYTEINRKLEMAESVLHQVDADKDTIQFGDIYHNIAYAYQRNGDYNQALAFYQKALKIREEKLGKDHPFTATTYHDIAAVYYAKGDYDRALEFFQKALKIFEEKLGTDHPDTATTYNNIAGVYYATGDYNRALEFFQKALKICEEKLGKGHPYTVVTYNNIAGVYYAKGDIQKSLEYFQRAMS